MIDPSLELVGGETVLCFEFLRVLDELIRSSDFALAGFGIGVSEKEIAGEWHFVAKFAAKEIEDRYAEFLTHEVETGEFECGVELSAVVVERGGWVADLEPKCFELERIVADEIGLEPFER
jgi:hypothetical protein